MIEGIAYAQQSSQTLQGILGKIYTYIINPAIVTLFAVALVIFFYGVIIYLRDAGKEGDAVKKGKAHMIWGIVGFVIMIGVYGIINLLIRTFNITGVTVSDQKIEVQDRTVPQVKLPNFKSQ